MFYTNQEIRKGTELKNLYSYYYISPCKQFSSLELLTISTFYLILILYNGTYI